MIFLSSKELPKSWRKRRSLEEMHRKERERLRKKIEDAKRDWVLEAIRVL
jgi:hypothetical protein